MEISSDVSEPSNELSAEPLCNIRLWSAAIPDQFVSIKIFSYRCGTTEPSVSFRQRGNERSFEERRREIHKILSSNIPLRLINAGRHTHTLTSTSHRRHDQFRQHAQARTSTHTVDVQPSSSLMFSIDPAIMSYQIMSDQQTGALEWFKLISITRFFSRIFFCCSFFL